GGLPVVLDGNVGPRGDGYVPSEQMSADEAAAYHDEQIATLAEAGAEMVTALTLNYADEAVGVARAAEARGLPSVISFTVEADELDSGDPRELADGYERLRERLPNLNVLGGCCGTDRRHVAAVIERLA